MDRFGTNWGGVLRPVKALVSAIDPELQAQIGLSAVQLDNLNLRRTGRALDHRSLRVLVDDNIDGLPGPVQYPPIRIKRNNLEIDVKVYNAFGKLHLRGASVRISRGAADMLEASIGDEIIIL